MSRLSSTIQLYKDAYSDHPKEVWLLAILTMINRMGTMVIPFLTVYLTTVLEFSLKEAGIIMSAFGIGSFIGSYLGGKLSDIIGANRIIVYSLFFSGLFLINLQFVTSFYGLISLIFLSSLFGESYRPALMVSLSDFVSKSQTGRTMSLIRMAINLGMTAAPAIGGFLAALYSYKWLFWIDGGTCILASIYFVIVSRKWKSKPRKEEEKKDNTNQEHPCIPPFKNKRFLMFLFATFLMGFGFIQWFHSVPVFIKTEWGFDERYIGVLLGINCLIITLIEMPIIHKVEKTSKIAGAMLVGVVCIGISFIPFLFEASLILAFLALFIWTMGEILHLPLNSSVALNISPTSKKGEYMAWYWMAWSLTNVTGPLVALTIAENFGFSTLWVLIIVLVLSSTILYTTLRKYMID